MMRIFTPGRFMPCLLMLAMFLFGTSEAWSQCSNTNVLYNVDITPTGIGAANSGFVNNIYGGEYVYATVCEGAVYSFSTCGTTYDTQITLYANVGGFSLDYDDDDGCGNGASYIEWTATFSGVIRILVNEYNCQSNSISTPLEMIQITACPALGGCPDNNTNYGDMTPDFVGDTEILTNVWGGDYYTLDVCTGADYSVSTCGTSWDSQITLYDDLTGDFLMYADDDGSCDNNETMNFTSNYDGTIRVVIDVYNCASNSTNGTLAITQETACAGACSFFDAAYEYLGCDGTDENVNFYAYYTGDCYVYSIWNSVNGGPFVELVLGDFYESGDPITLWLPADNSVYDFYFELNDGTTSEIYFYETGSCDTFCDFFGSTEDYIGCVETDELVEFTPLFTGDCTVYSIWNSVDGGPFVELVLGGVFGSGDPIALYLPADNTLYEYYYELNDGSLSDIYSYFTGTCDGDFCEFIDAAADYMGCDGTDEAVDFYAYYTGDCTVYSIWNSVNGGPYVELVLGGFYQSGDAISLVLPADNSDYTFYFELSDGSMSDLYLYTTGNCDGEACEFIDAAADYVGCDGTDEQVDFYAYFTGDCTVASFWNSVNGSPYDELVLTGNFESGDAISLLLPADNSDYVFYFELSDGTVSELYLYSTGNCDGPSCSNLDIDYDNTGCFETINGPTPSGNITPFFVGGCTVEGIFTSVNNGPFEYLDLSGYGFESGDDIGLFFNIQDADYEVYYVLSDGSESPSVFFTTDACESGETICDCAGTQLPIESLVWHGDGSLDDGSFLWGGDPDLPVDFNCATWGFDCNDEQDELTPLFDPYGTCSGNLPPSNGCVDEFCYNISLDIVTDCFPGESSMFLYTEGGDLALAIPEGSFTEEYTFYETNVCMPAGCYTFVIEDSYGDGMDSGDCIEMGSFGVYDYGEGAYIFTGEGNDYTLSYNEEFCIGPQTECSDLEMDIISGSCYPAGDDLLPTISYTFDFNGSCDVQSLFYSENGDEFVEVDVSANNWGSGDEGMLYYLQPNSDYVIYYTTDDGASSFLYAFSTEDCNNEITICDCDGTQHSIGVTAWLGDGYADNGFYEWAGQLVDFNCATWGYDCDDIDGSPNTDPYNVCEGQLPPFNGCIDEEEVLGCTDPEALNYDSDATINDGSCIYNLQVGCTDDEACNYNELAIIDDNSCEYISCVGCTDEEATNYDPTATIDDGSCNYEDVIGCTDEEALNYNPLATVNQGCIYTCIWPSVFYEPHCVQGDLDNFYVDVEVAALGNGSPYTITNSYNNQQQVMSLNGSFTMGPFPIGTLVVVQVTSNSIECMLTSQPLTEDCSEGGVYGCTDPEALNYNPEATIDDGNCVYPSVDELSIQYFSMYPNPAKDQVTITNNGNTSQLSIRIMDGTGRLVTTEQVVMNTGSSHGMDVSALAQGNYIVEILSSGKVEHHSLVIQK